MIDIFTFFFYKEPFFLGQVSVLIGIVVVVCHDQHPINHNWEEILLPNKEERATWARFKNTDKINRKDKEGNQTQMERIANKISPVATSVSRAVATITTGRTTLKSRNH